MYRVLLIFIVITTLFLGSNVLYFLGWKIGGNSSSSYQQLLPQLYISFLLLYFINKDIIKLKIDELRLIGVVLILIIYMILNSNTGLLSSIPNGLLLPALISLFIYQSNKLKNYLRIMLISFLILNNLFAIVEYIISVNLFPFTQSKEEFMEYEYLFRSTAFQNHPLNNALITSTILSAILIYRNYSYKFKLITLTISLLAFMCFNTRSSILIWTIISGLYIFYLLINKNTSFFSKLSLIMFSIIGILGIIYLFYYKGWGNRLVELDLSKNDDSINTRFKAWDIFNEYTLNDFLGGSSINKYNRIMIKMGLVHLENYWIIFLLRYGLIFTTLLSLFYFKLLNKIFEKYSYFSKIFILGLFLILSSTNNSLAYSEQPLTVLILTGYAFCPININRIINTNANFIYNTRI